jgi:hypothetical protein
VTERPNAAEDNDADEDVGEIDGVEEVPVDDEDAGSGIGLSATFP